MQDMFVPLLLTSRWMGFTIKAIIISENVAGSFKLQFLIFTEMSGFRYILSTSTALFLRFCVAVPRLALESVSQSHYDIANSMTPGAIIDILSFP